MQYPNPAKGMKSEKATEVLSNQKPMSSLYVEPLAFTKFIMLISR